jgi:hypothetical protein
LYLEVTDPLRINDDDGPLLAKAVTTGSSEDNFSFDALLLDFLVKRGGNLSSSGRVTGTPGTERNTRLIRISLGEDLLPEIFQFGR